MIDPRAAEGMPLDVRDMLAKATAQAHAALHVHPWLARLGTPGLAGDVYRRILTSYLEVYRNMERNRADLGQFAQLTLAPQVATLQDDLAALGVPRDTAPADQENLTSAGTPAAVLGGLYVLHGAGFGGRTLALSVARSLPDAPRRFFSLGTAPPVWRDLKRALQTFADSPAAQADLIRGASATFAIVGETVTQHCERGGTFHPLSENPAPAAHHVH